MSDSQQTAVPTHVGLILDGNRRWAKSHNLPVYEGHLAGYNTLKEISKAALKRGVQYLSVYVFSSENWSRAKTEVNFIMSLAYKMVTQDLRELHDENIKLLWLGSRERVNGKLQKAIDNAVESTKGNSGGILCLCFNYGGQQEIVDAAKKLVEEGREITVENFQGALYGPEVPNIDLLIRTSGEYRTSGYMLWRAAYAELYFSDKYWPDFNEADFDTALKEYASRHRRFGK